MNAPMSDVPCIGRQEAARLLGVDPRTLDRMVMRRDIDAQQTPSGRWMLSPATVERARKLLSDD